MNDPITDCLLSIAFMIKSPFAGVTLWALLKVDNNLNQFKSSHLVFFLGLDLLLLILPLVLVPFVLPLLIPLLWAVQVVQSGKVSPVAPSYFFPSEK